MVGSGRSRKPSPGEVTLLLYPRALVPHLHRDRLGEAEERLDGLPEDHRGGVEVHLLALRLGGEGTLASSAEDAVEEFYTLRVAGLAPRVDGRARSELLGVGGPADPLRRRYSFFLTSLPLTTSEAM